MDMPVRLLEAHPLAEEIRNQVVVKRGPIVYCLESMDIDGGKRIDDVQIPTNIKFTPRKMQTLPQTGDGFPLLAIVVVSLASATGIVLLTVKQKNALKETSDEEDADESADR